MNDEIWDCTWHWQTVLPHRKGELCRVVGSGFKRDGIDVATIEFAEDGYRIVANRRAVRRLPRDVA